MTIRMRLAGDPAEIEIMVQVLAVIFQLDGTGRLYPLRGTPGVRLYMTAHIPHRSTPGETKRHRQGPAL